MTNSRMELLLFWAILCCSSALVGSSTLSEHQVITVHTGKTGFKHALTLVEQFDLDVWSSRFHVGEMDIMIQKKFVAPLFRKFNYTILHEDVQAYYDRFKIVPYYGTVNGSDGDDFYKEFRSYGQQMSRVRALCSAHSSICTEFVVGHTVEGRDIFAVSIEGGTGGREIVYNGNIHAREWLSPMTVLYILEQLITQYDSNANVKALVDKFKWTIITVLNVDGRIFTEGGSGDRNWRKNRRINEGTNYIGVDLNRNFDYMWDSGGSSGDPSSGTYHGPYELSEPEAIVLKNYICSQHGNVIHYIDWHQQGNMLMSPWGYTATLPEDYPEQMNFGKPAIEAIEKTHGATWKLGSIYNVIYQASGGTNDCMYANCDVLYSFAVELRATVDGSSILLSGTECWNGVVAMGNYLANLPDKQQQQ